MLPTLKVLVYNNSGYSKLQFHYTVFLHVFKYNADHSGRAV
jgi:hypothetical protein